jgi:tripartite-type tricarboxylate transporter receptor subunit TctC
MKQLIRNGVLTLCALMSVSVSVGVSAQSSYPDKPISIITPLAAGSAVDNAMRILAPALTKALGGVSLIMENMPGASGIIGAQRVASAPPDGYTLGAFNDSILTMVPNLQANMPWDPIKDFTPVSLVATLEWGLFDTPNLPYKNAADLIAAARAAPGKINYASGGIGSPQHIAMALFAARNHLNMLHVPYRGATPAAVGVASGEAQVGFSALATIKSLVDGKKLKLLGVSSDKVLPQAPGVPTISSSGSPGFVFSSWFVIVAPRNTPPAIVDRLNKAIKVALADPTVRAKLLEQGAIATGSSAAQLGQMTQENLATYKKLIADNHIQTN